MSENGDNSPDEQAVKDVSEAVKTQMQAAEKLQEVVEKHDGDEIQDAMEAVVGSLEQEFDSVGRLERLYMMTYSVADTIGSDSMANYAKGKLENLAQDE